MKNKRTEMRVFGAVSGIAVALMFGLIFPLLRESELPSWPWGVAGILWLSAVVYPRLLVPLQRVMHFIGSRVIGLINWFVLGIFYYLILVPYSFVLRATGKITIKKGFDRNADSYRIVLTSKMPIDLEKPF